MSEGTLESDAAARILNAIEEGLVLIVPSGSITYANPAAERILGLEKSQIEARHYTSPEWDIVRTDGTPMPPEEMAGPMAMTTRQRVRNVVMGVKKGDGSVRWINVSATPLFAQSGEFEGIAGIFTDITDMHLLAEEVARHQQHLEILVEERTSELMDANRRLAREVDERSAAERSLQRAEEALRSTLASMDDLVFVLNDDGIFVEYFQPSLKSELFVPPESFVDRPIEEVLPAQLVADLRPLVAEVLSTGEVRRLEYSLPLSNEERWFEAKISGRRGPDGTFDGVTIVARDVTEEKKLKARKDALTNALRMQATTDSLTGLPNRRMMDEWLAGETERAQRYGRDLSVVLMDIDQFKETNDTHGHAAGDEVLKATAAAARKALRSTDRIARVGGDEFLLMLPETDLGEACRLAERVREAVRATVTLPGGSDAVSSTASFGVAQLGPDSAEGAGDLVARADAAMYRAKQAGRDRLWPPLGGRPSVTGP